GSTFTVYLPAAAGVAADVRKPTEQDANAMNGVVLVVDDEDTIRRTAKSILEKRGLHVLIAESGRAGVEAFLRLLDPVSLVLLDVTMPLMGGNEVLREIKALRADVPVIMSSGYDETEAMHRVTGGEVAGFIRKPYTSAQLIDKIKVTLG